VEGRKGFYKKIPIVLVVLGQKNIWRCFFHRRDVFEQRLVWSLGLCL
jgi:hypothetical protein